MLDYFKISSALKEKKLSVSKMLNFISSLGDHFSIDDAIAISNEKKANANVSTPGQEEKIKKALEARFHKALIEEIAGLREIWAYRSTYDFTTSEKKFNSTIHNPKRWIDGLCPIITRIVNNYGKGVAYSNKDVHPSMTIDIDLTPDFLIENIQLEAKTYIKKVGFTHDYLETKEGDKDYFKNLANITVKVEPLYLKNVSLLQIVSYFGLDELIDKSIIFGADIDYKEDSTKKTAAQMYNYYTGVPAHYTAYIKSLLDGSFENGKYKIIYEKRKLEENLTGEAKPLEAQVQNVNKI